MQDLFQYYCYRFNDFYEPEFCKLIRSSWQLLQQFCNQCLTGNMIRRIGLRTVDETYTASQLCPREEGTNLTEQLCRFGCHPALSSGQTCNRRLSRKPLQDILER